MDTVDEPRLSSSSATPPSSSGPAAGPRQRPQARGVPLPSLSGEAAEHAPSPLPKVLASPSSPPPGPLRPRRRRPPRRRTLLCSSSQATDRGGQHDGAAPAAEPPRRRRRRRKRGGRRRRGGRQRGSRSTQAAGTSPPPPAGPPPAARSYADAARCACPRQAPAEAARRTVTSGRGRRRPSPPVARANDATPSSPRPTRRPPGLPAPPALRQPRQPSSPPPLQPTRCGSRPARATRRQAPGDAGDDGSHRLFVVWLARPSCSAVDDWARLQAALRLVKGLTVSGRGALVVAMEAVLPRPTAAGRRGSRPPVSAGGGGGDADGGGLGE